MFTSKKIAKAAEKTVEHLEGLLEASSELVSLYHKYEDEMPEDLAEAITEVLKNVAKFGLGAIVGSGAMDSLMNDED